MPKTYHVLLIEDNLMDIELAKEAFIDTKQDSIIHIAETGQQALDYLLGNGDFQNRHEYPLPDLVFLDMKLPDMKGYQVLEKIKNLPLLRQIPVIALTSSREQTDLIHCYENHVNSYMVKPVSFEGFLELISKVEEYWLVLNVPPPLVMHSK